MSTRYDIHHRPVSPTTTSVATQARRGIRFGLFAVLVVGVRRRHLGAVVNAVLALLATQLPGLLERRYDVELQPWQHLYADTAMLTHAIGMLGPYDDVWWWDHLTHTHSATLLGGLVHTIARRRNRNPRPRVLAVVILVGVIWEILEYLIHTTADLLNLEPILVTYGEQDTLLDLCFDLLGATLVLALGDRLLQNVIEPRD